MAPPAARSSLAWTVVAFAAAGTALAALEAVRLGSGGLAAVLVPLFAATAVIAAGVIGGAERLVAERPRWIVALAVAATSLIVTVPVGQTLFRGAYAATLPGASVLPYIAPVVAWLAIAAAIFGGDKLARGDLTGRAIVILALALVFGGIIWAKRNVLGASYPAAHLGGTLAVIVLAGLGVRVARRARPPWFVAAGIAAVALGGAGAMVFVGLAEARDRQLLANRGELGRDLVRLWRELGDFDRDGSSVLLGGGDCDDANAARYPGAADVPADGVDQDCDGADAVKVAAAQTAMPTAGALDAWRTSVAVQGVLERTKGMNVILITVDALRFDLLAPDAPNRTDFPRLARMLDESVQFTRAFSPATGTDASLSTLLTGRADPFQRVDKTLPEAIRELDRFTASAIPSEVTRHVGEVLLGRGFERIRPVYTDWEKDNIGDHISAGTTTEEGLRAVAKAGDKPWFVWLHYFDVHEHHQLDIPEELRKAVTSGGSEKAHRYRALLFAVDRSVGRLLDTLAERGHLDRTIIVFASDHGESLGDDPRLGPTHGKVTYAPLVRIPLAFRIPGVTPGVRTDSVSLLDIAPTMLELLGAPRGIDKLDGYDLVPAILDGPRELRPPPNRALVIHEEQQWSVVEWPYQLVARPAEDLVELYDLERDPRAREDIARREPAITARLRARYAEVPRVRIDRTAAGRAWREQQAQPPRPRATP